MWPRSSRGHQLPELVQSTQESQVSAVSLSATFVKWFCRDSVSLVTRRLCTFRLFDEIFYLIGWFPCRTRVLYNSQGCEMGPSQKHSVWNGMGAVPNSPACITDNRLYLVNSVGPPVPPSLLRTRTNHRLPSRVGYRLLRCKGHILRGGSWTSVTDSRLCSQGRPLTLPLASHSTPPRTQSPWPPDPWLSAPLAATSPAVESPRLPATNHYSTSARLRPRSIVSNAPQPITTKHLLCSPAPAKARGVG